MSNNRNLSKFANTLDNGTNGQSLISDGDGGVIFGTASGGAVSVYATSNLLPLTGVTNGTMAFVTSSNRLYIWSGTGWYTVAVVSNESPTSISGANEYYLLATDGTPLILTLTSTDPEGIAITYDYTPTDLVNKATISQTDNVFTITPSTNPADAGIFNITFSATDGINIVTRSATFENLGTPYNSITEMYNANLPNGIYTVTIAGLGDRRLRYASYNNKGWVEVLCSSNNSSTTPIDNWVGNTNAGWNSSLGDGTRYFLKNYNLNNGLALNYSGSSSVILLGSGFNATDIAITSKSSMTANGVTATGQNQLSALPLTLADLSGSNVATVSTLLLNYFKGTGSGFHSVDEYSTGWVKAGQGTFDISLYYREGSPNTDEWHIADGTSAISTTYYSNIGYRTGAYPARNVGSWSSGTGAKNSIYQISSTNVLSIWLTDM